jgi:hypothetical protein
MGTGQGWRQILFHKRDRVIFWGRKMEKFPPLILHPIDISMAKTPLGHLYCFLCNNTKKIIN